MRAVFQDVHDQLAVVRVGDAQQVAAVWLQLALLLGVPLLVLDPRGALRAETQARPMDAAT